MSIFKKLLFQWRKHVAIKTAVRAHEADGRKYLVIVLDGKPIVTTKGMIRKMKARGALKRGVTLQDFEKRALFVTK